MNPEVSVAVISAVALLSHDCVNITLGHASETC